MRLTSLCYIEKNGQYLMLHRTKKAQDPNEGKWLGIGGKFEDGESPEDCVLREVKEETGFTLTKYSFRGIVTFVNDVCENEYMHLFTATEYEGDMLPCNEGDLEWVDIEKVPELNLWEGDKVFLDLLENRKEFFSLKLIYEGDHLKKWILYDEKKI